MPLSDPHWQGALAAFAAVAIGQTLRRLRAKRPEEQRSDRGAGRWAETPKSLSYRLGYIWARCQHMSKQRLPWP